MHKYLGSFHRVNLFCWCVFACLMHPTSKFDKTVLSKCVCVCVTKSCVRKLCVKGLCVKTGGGRGG